mgnify:CR=1 FL=1
MSYLYSINNFALTNAAKLNLVFCLILLTSSAMAQNLTQHHIVIAHRGASGYLPEHTMESKSRAYAMGADYIEQDLVLTKDDVPVVMHDIYLDEVTDVAQVYPNRSREDGRYYIIDFTLQEVLRLSVNERISVETQQPEYPKRFPHGKSLFRLHTFEKEIELIQGLNQSSGKQIGIYPEIKNPAFHRKQGKDISKIVLDILKKYGYQNKSDRCILQCFDAAELQRIRFELKSELFLTQLMEFPDGISDLEGYAHYADAIGPPISQLIFSSYKIQGKTYSDLIREAHNLKLKVHPYTLRIEELKAFPNFDALLEFCFETLNIDGAFTDFPDKAIDYLRK